MMRNNNKVFKSDLDREVIVNEFLKPVYYDTILEPLSEGCLVNYKHIDYNNEPEKQLRGVDVEYKQISSEFPIYIDEKSSTYYYNKPKPLDTFIVEGLSTTTIDVPTVGWYLDKKRLTTHYLIVWIDNVYGDSLINSSSISRAEMVLIPKEALKSYVNYVLKISDDLFYNLCIETLNQYNRLPESAKLKYKAVGGYSNPKYSIKKNGFKINLSLRISNQPINILLPRDAYRFIAYKYNYGQFNCYYDQGQLIPQKPKNINTPEYSDNINISNKLQL